MKSSLFHSGLLTGHESERVVMPEDEEMVTMADRGSLSSQRGEGQG